MDNKQTNGYPQNTVSPAAAGITGFILGVMGTAAIVLADKKTRTTVNQKAAEMKDTVKKWSKETLNDLQATSEQAEDMLSDKEEDRGEKIKKEL